MTQPATPHLPYCYLSSRSRWWTSRRAPSHSLRFSKWQKDPHTMEKPMISDKSKRQNRPHHTLTLLLSLFTISLMEESDGTLLRGCKIVHENWHRNEFPVFYNNYDWLIDFSAEYKLSLPSYKKKCALNQNCNVPPRLMHFVKHIFFVF